MNGCWYATKLEKAFHMLVSPLVPRVGAWAAEVVKTVIVSTLSSIQPTFKEENLWSPNCHFLGWCRHCTTWKSAKLGKTWHELFNSTLFKYHVLLPVPRCQPLFVIFCQCWFWYSNAMHSNICVATFFMQYLRSNIFGAISIITSVGWRMVVH